MKNNVLCLNGNRLLLDNSAPSRLLGRKINGTLTQYQRPETLQSCVCTQGHGDVGRFKVLGPGGGKGLDQGSDLGGGAVAEMSLPPPPDFPDYHFLRLSPCFFPPLLLPSLSPLPLRFCQTAAWAVATTSSFAQRGCFRLEPRQCTQGEPETVASACCKGTTSASSCTPARWMR